MHWCVTPTSPHSLPLFSVRTPFVSMSAAINHHNNKSEVLEHWILSCKSTTAGSLLFATFAGYESVHCNPSYLECVHSHCFRCFFRYCPSVATVREAMQDRERGDVQGVRGAGTMANVQVVSSATHPETPALPVPAWYLRSLGTLHLEALLQPALRRAPIKLANAVTTKASRSDDLPG